MPIENNLSLATGAALTPETWADFVQRLHHHCKGAGVKDHCTANAIFIVQAKRIVSGIDKDYTDQLMVICDDCQWFTIQEYWDDLDEHGRACLNRKMQDWSDCQFMKADESDQWYVLGELDDHIVTGWDERWEYINAHFTKEAAEEFIRRKKRDYRHGMRVYVDSQYYAWEFNAVIAAILSGQLVIQQQAAA